MAQGKAVKRKQLKVHNYYKFCSHCDRHIYEDQDYILVKSKRNNDGEYFHKDHTGCAESSQEGFSALTRGQSRRWTIF